KIA
ncbi:GAF domain protein, partial [Vibrio parahaemolyticus V-223/04]